MKSFHCLVCNRELSDPKSIDRGVGPVCWTRLKWRRLREARGIMSSYELSGWTYTKRILAKCGLDLESLIPNKEAV